MKKILFLILGCIFAQSSVNAMEQKQKAPAAVPRKKLIIVRPQRIAEDAPSASVVMAEQPAVVQPVTTVEQMAVAEPVTVVEAIVPVEVAQLQIPSVNTKVNREGILLELIYSPKAASKMKKINVTEADVKAVIESGEEHFTKFGTVYSMVYLNEYLNGVTYLKYLTVRIVPKKLSNKVRIKSVFFTEKPGVAVEQVPTVEIAHPPKGMSNAMVNRNGEFFNLFYSDHARARMEERDVSELDIELAIEYGNKFLDTKYPDCIMYQDRSIKTNRYPVAVATMMPRRDHPNKIVIKTVYPAYPIGCEKKSRKSSKKKDTPGASVEEMKKMGTVTEAQLNKLRIQIERKREEKIRDARINKENRSVVRKNAMLGKK